MDYHKVCNLLRTFWKAIGRFGNMPGKCFGNQTNHSYFKLIYSNTEVSQLYQHTGGGHFVLLDRFVSMKQ